MKKLTPAELWKKEADRLQALVDGLNAEGTKLRQRNLKLTEVARFAKQAIATEGYLLDDGQLSEAFDKLVDVLSEE